METSKPVSLHVSSEIIMMVYKFREEIFFAKKYPSDWKRNTSKMLSYYIYCTADYSLDDFLIQTFCQPNSFHSQFADFLFQTYLQSDRDFSICT